MTKPSRRTPKKVYFEVENRSDNGEYCQCEYEDALIGRCQCRAEHMTHFKHRKAGGTTSMEVHSVENVFYYCKYHHDKLDGR